MSEYLPKDWRDQVTVDPTTEELDRAEEALFLSAKAGTLFEPEMNASEWDEFCHAATLEEQERRDGVPRARSSLTKEQRTVLAQGSDSVKSAGVRKVLKRRDDLIKRLRPQCTAVNDDEKIMEEMLDDLGITAEEFKNVDKTLGAITPQEWEDLQARNKPKGQ